ncbi:MAG TPA: hypothetical protein VFU12_15865 [Glycomyces sp.]|nr:hypothetical protein [Glycomyces sp.]
MPRRPPARIRAHATKRPRPWSARRTPGLPVGSGGLAAAIRRLEHRRSDLEPGGVADAFTRWARLSSGPARRLTTDMCCLHGCCEPDPRALLELAVHLLPRRSARELRRLLEPIDRRFRERTLPDPFAPPGPWWTRRLAQGVLD